MTQPRITGWHFDPRDTPQQRTILRRTRAAQWTRLHFPAGTRVRAMVSGQEGRVKRHVPGVNAQGGTVVVWWDSGHEGRHSACTLEAVR